MLVPGAVDGADSLPHADDAQERNRSRSDRQRQRTLRAPAERARADAPLPPARPATALHDEAVRPRARLAGRRDPRRRLRTRRRSLPLRPRDARRDRPAHEAGDRLRQGPEVGAGALRARDRPHRGVRPARGSRRLELRRLAVGHDHARPRRPAAGHALAPLVPARPQRADLLLRQHRLHARPDQRRLVDLPRGAGSDARHRRAPHRAADQLPDHARLPRLQAAREQAPRRLHERRPALLRAAELRATRRSTSTRGTRSWTAGRR